jgi:integrase/recombinase XerC
MNRDIGLSKTLYTRALEYCSELEGEYLFELSYPRLDQIWSLYKPSGKKFHSLRHTFALMLYDKTKDILLLKRALGHRNINNTMVYANFAASKDDFKKMAL